jgi:hypothetical protein
VLDFGAMLHCDRVSLINCRIDEFDDFTPKSFCRVVVSGDFFA